ncbi:MAG: TRAP transporter substrate-binding protein DctP [Alphaproteobacteria bacterium]|jgi:TRAP-type C4-dicarboxylate transport system substrate-binding protein|nr:TRAP transporter substrate-binding protein DctP [Alphaproteobacteria bacterium]
MPRSFAALRLFAAAAFAMMLAPVSVSAQITLKIADSFPKGHVIYDMVVDVMIPALEEGGKIKVQYFPANQLGQMRDIIEAARTGVADIAYVAPGVVSGRMPASNLLSLPGQFESGEHLARVFTRVAAGALKQEYDRLGIRIIAASGTPPYQIFTRNKQVRLPADARGLKLRGGGGDADDFMRELGISVINLPASQMYESLQKGVIDGAAYLQATAAANHLQEVTKYATEGAPLMSLLALYFVDQQRFNSFPPDIQEIILKAGEKFAIAMGAEYDRRDREAKSIFTSAGGQVHTLTPAEIRAWQDSYRDAPEKMIAKLEGRGFRYVRDVYNELQSARAAIRPSN